jgi:hypothetical protein
MAESRTRDVPCISAKITTFKEYSFVRISYKGFVFCIDAVDGTIALLNSFAAAPKSGHGNDGQSI